MWTQATAKNAIIVAGSLGMVHTQLTMSPATIEYARALGATGFQFGLIGALPTAMICMQFIAAVAANHLHHRRRLWMAVTLAQRLILVPLAIAVAVWTEVDDSFWVWGLILFTAVNHGLLHFGTPLWLSWMGDYLPSHGLSRFWGVRQLWMQWAAAGSMLVGALLLTASGLEIRTGFAWMIVIGAVFGVADVLLFLKVDEPPVTRVPKPQLRSVLAAPFRERGFRRFIAYTCFWNFSAMVGAPFISLYLLSHVGMNLGSLLLLWTLSWVGGALFSRKLGMLIESFGNRPVLILCTALKSTNMAALILIPANPAIAFAILAPVFMLDALLNAGIAIANNGFMLKNSPAENRTMYIAAGTALAGMAGGAASVAAGCALSGLGGWQIATGGWNPFQLLFAASLVLRWVSIIFALRLHEPESRGASDVMTLLIGATPTRLIRFPVGLYRSMWTAADTTAGRAADREPAGRDGELPAPTHPASIAER